jgi:hypothetical protein
MTSLINSSFLFLLIEHADLVDVPGRHLVLLNEYLNNGINVVALNLHNKSVHL